MPAYLTESTDAAARNGEEAIIDYLLLSRCNILVHNSSGLARTVLLANAEQPHINTHLNRKSSISPGGSAASRSTSGTSGWVLLEAWEPINPRPFGLR